MTKKYDVLTVGGATRDIMFYSGEGELISTGNLTKQKLLAFEYGAKIMAHEVYFSFGGGAANTATSFARLGLRVAVICRVGADDNGREIIKNLKQNKIAVDFVKIDRQVSTGFSVILTVNNPAKEHIAFLHRGANNYLTVGDLPLSKIKTKWFYISSLPADNWEKIMAALAKQKSNLVWNPGGQQLAKIGAVKKLLPKIKILIINRDEALEFKKLKDLKGLIHYITQLGPGITVITDGENGVYAYDRKKYYYMKAKKTKSMDTIGVGDAFSSAFTAALIYGKTIKQALAWGVKNSSSVVSRVGAQNGVLNKKQIER